jgi:hypothetical protein
VVGTESVQGYGGLGPAGNQFAGNFLRNGSGGTRLNPGSVSPSTTTLTLTGLPAHSAIDLGFLLAIISSWDGSSGEGAAGGDFFNIQVDGVVVFSESFDKFFETDQSYVPPPGGLLTPRPFPDLGFPDPDQPGAVFPDAAYNMALELRLNNIPHTSSSLTVEWFASGPGWQGGNDESWAIENLVVNLDVAATVPAPPSVVLLGVGAALLGARRRQCRRPDNDSA